MLRNRTHRMADGVRVPGTWRHVFIRNRGYHLTDLFIYADGLIDCWELVTLEQFEQKLRDGWIATSLPEGGEASAFDLASWRFGEPHLHFTPETLLAEIRDAIDDLNDRPNSTARCMAAVAVFLADRTKEHRAAALAAYLAIPETHRIYALGDMDARDRPLQVLLAGPGGRTQSHPGRRVSKADYLAAVARVAVMTGLLRAKFDQHPDLAAILLATDDATVLYDDQSAFWGDNGGKGRNWTGRLLELVRSELWGRRAGIP